jgi:hypothetical protein
MFQVFYLDIAYVCYGSIRMFQACFRYFKLMLQVFHLDVAKVDLNVAYVVMAIHGRFKRIFSSVSSVSDVCCKCFIFMFQK